MRGHGLSGCMDGLMMYWTDFKVHCSDLVAVVDDAKARHPGLPSFIFTESMGGVFWWFPLVFVFSWMADRKFSLLFLFLALFFSHHIQVHL